MKLYRENGTLNYIKLFVLLTAIYVVLVSLFYYASGEELHYRESAGNIEEFTADNIVGELTTGRRIEQTYENEIGFPEKVGVMLSNYDRGVQGSLLLELYIADSGEFLAAKQIPAEKIGLNRYEYLEFDSGQRNLHGVLLQVVLTAEAGEPGIAPTALYNSKQELKQGNLRIDGEPVNGSLCIAVYGKDEVWTGHHFKELAVGFFMLLSLLYLLCAWRHAHGKKELFFSTALAMKKYGFLMEQLVSRDFKVRYKRSMLGMFWSFLNPLLTMVVQFIVFSQLFKSGIDNVAGYMLSGIVVFNFFNEAVGQALGAIVYNASLITKVYVPKYIYPVTKVLSSCVNFMISLGALFVVVLFTKEPITKAFLLLPFLIVCVTLFSIGFGMLLSALMVFFRDIQFLWGIFSMLWMYLTPLFYPETILAEQYRWIFKCNPMYYYVKFMRSIVLDGVSPEPRLYILCALFSFGALTVGGLVFKKTQNKFILNI